MIALAQVIAAGKSATVLLGLCAISWAAYVSPVYRKEAPLVDVAQRILLGEQYSNAQLSAVLDKAEASSTPRLAAAVKGEALIRLVLVERDWNKSKSGLLSSIGRPQMAVDAALAHAPTSSFMWLTSYWFKHPRGDGTQDLNLLFMSYRTGPNEAWIASRRIPVTLSIFAWLPNDLAEQALSEFAGLVRARLYADAANTLAGSGWPIHERLLNRLVEVDEDNRRQFARILTSRGLEDAVVPGITSERFRRF